MWLILCVAVAAALPADQFMDNHHLRDLQKLDLQDLQPVQVLKNVNIQNEQDLEDALVRLAGLAGHLSQCGRDLQAFNSLYEPVEGIHSSVPLLLSSYDACTGSSGTVVHISKPDVSSMPENFSKNRWLCLPASCPGELLEALQTSPTTSSTSAGPDLFASLGPEHWIVLVIVLIIIGFPILLTIFEKKLTSSLQAESRWRRPLLAFSMRSGYSRLVAPDPPGSITCLNGIRVFSCAYIIFGHIAINNGPVSAEELKGQIKYVLRNNFYMAVDAFLCVAGMLNALSLMRQLSGTKKFNFFSYVVHRLFRIFPMLFIICIFAVTWDSAGSVIFSESTDEDQSCSPNWWIQLLFLSNFITPETNCPILDHTWYLSLDMQLYLLAPLLVLPLVWRPRWGRVWLGLVTVLAHVVPGALACAYHIRGQVADVLTKEEGELVSRVLYNPLYSRAGPYLVGMVVGYLMHQWKNGSISFNPSKAVCRLLTCTGFVLLIGTLLFTYPFNVSPIPFNGPAVFFFNGFYRSLWAFGLLLIVIVCERNGGGVVNGFLSWRGFTIPSRLTFSIYLLHVHMIQIVMSEDYGTWFYEIRDTISVFCFTTALAYLFFLCVEQPFASLEAAIRQKPHKAQEQKQQPKSNSLMVESC